MSWGSPLWLWELAAPVAGALVLVLLMVRRRRRSREILWPGIQRVIATAAGVQAIAAGRTVRRPWLLLLALTLLILALARPQWGSTEEQVVEQAREVMIALDLSRSMLVEDVPPSRLGRARLLVQSLLEGLRGERVGLIVFAGTAFVQVPLSADYQILHEFLPELKPDYMPQGGTDYAGMLRAALGGFTSSANTDRYLIVLSDGESQSEDWRSLVPELAERGVRVLALGTGTSNGGFIPDGQNGFMKDERGAVVLSRLEPATLQSLARESGGVFRDASTWIDLPALLADTIAQGRQGQFAEQRTVRQIERFQWFLAPAVAFALLGLWREVNVRPRQRELAHANLTTPHTPSPRAGTRPTAAGALGMGLIVLALVGSFTIRSSRAADMAAAANDDPAARVRETVSKLIDTPDPSARDWRELAQRTLVYGTNARMSQQPIVPGAIHDALVAVDRGEKADRFIADWPKLREDLRQLLENPPQEQPPPEEQPQNEEQKEQEQQQQQQQQQDQSSNSSPNESSPSPQDPANSKSGESPPTDSQQQEQQQQQQSSSADSSQSPQQPSEPDTPSQPPPQGGEMGELQKEQQPPPPTQPSSHDEARSQKTRKFGGRPAGAQNPPTNPEDAVALEHLRQASEDDSPARLFQLLEDPTPQPAPRGRDW